MARSELCTRSAHPSSGGLGPERIGEAVSQMAQVLVKAACAGDLDEGVGRIRALASLAADAEVTAKHADVVVRQPLGLWAQALLEYVVREGYLPPPQLLRIVMSTQPSAATSYGVEDQLTTLIGITAEHDGLYALPLAVEPWIHGTGYDPTLISRTSLKKLRAKWRGAPFPSAAAGTVGLLLDSIESGCDAIGGDDSEAFGRFLPVGAAPWRYGAPDDWTMAPRVAAAGDIAGALEQISQHKRPGVLIAMVDASGEQVGSLDAGTELVTASGQRVQGDEFLEQLRSGEGPVGDDLVDIEDVQLPPGVRCQRTRGGLRSRDGVRQLMVWRELGADVVTFVHNVNVGPRNDRLLVQTAARVLNIDRDPGRAGCLRRFFDTHGAPFSCQGTSYETRKALFGLAALANVAVVAAGRSDPAQ